MKKLYLFAALAAMLAACSENDLTAEKQVVQQNAEEGAVDFDLYIGRGLTRGGLNGPITTTTIQTGDHKDAGFGVFGYYTDGEPYSAITKPNFFYNQQVTYDGAKWIYDPVKYWPNEFGGDARSDQVDRLTLFAYLPWVEVDPLTGVVKPETNTSATDAQKNAKDPTTNITGMTRNTATGDPFIKYSATMDPNNSVDLCYGVAAATFTSSNSAINQNNIEKGKPYVDVVKPGTDANSKIKFDFKHATAQMRVTIDAVVDNKTTGGDDINQNETRIWVRSVTFTGITQKGALNLHSDANEGPEWYDVNGNSKITTGSLTVFDGRKDDKEANDKASNETPATLNTQIVQAKQYKLAEGTGYITEPGETGVIKTRYNLFNSSDVNAPVFVIPTKEKMRVTIVYDVETVDKNLPYYLSDGKTPGSTIQNTIYKDIETFGEITAGYCYTLNLHLGMRSVDFDAEVTPWQYNGADVDLPSNMQTFAIGTDPNPKLTLPADLTTYQFAVSGLTVNSTPTLTDFSIGGVNVTSSATPANGSGISVVTVTGITANSVVTKKSGNWVITDGPTTKTVTVDVTQQAAPLGLKVDKVNNQVLYLTKTTGSAWNEAITDATKVEQIKVWRNGKQLITRAGSGTAANVNEVNVQTTGRLDDYCALYFNSPLQPGDIVTVWVKAVDATEESVTANISGISFAPATKEVEFGQTGVKFKPTFIGGEDLDFSDYTWSPSLTTYATVTASSGEISITKAGGPTEITATMKSDVTNALKEKGYIFISTPVTASYRLTVNPAQGKIVFDAPSLSPFNTYSEGSTIFDLTEDGKKAVLKNSFDDELTSGSIGTISYSISGTEAGYFKLESNVLKFNSGWNAGDSHKVTVTATVTGTPTDVVYAVTEKHYEIEVKAAP